MGAESLFPDHFSAVARSYADFRPRYPESLFDYLASMGPRDSTVWDCATGNGQAAVSLAERFSRVVATDASREQIDAAQRHPRVDYRVALAEHSGLPDQAAAGVTVAQALHWFDLPRFYAEVRRVLVPGGFVAVWAYGVNRIEGADADRVARHFYGETLGAYWPESRRLVEEGYASLPFPFVEEHPPAFQMEATWTLDQLLGYYGTWSATRQYIKQRGEDPLIPLRSELAHTWRDGGTRRVTWPLALRVGRVTGLADTCQDKKS